MISNDVIDAQAGDHSAFTRAVEPYRLELHRHCYRMTGSVDDADDLLQETLFRAWRSLGTYAGRSSFRAWLYWIATNRTIDSLGGKSRQEIAIEWQGQSEGLEPMWLQPYHQETDPAAALERSEELAVAFVVAVQSLPPLQRAALLLKDVLGFSVPDTAEALETTTASTNSALQRARAKMASEVYVGPPSNLERQLRDELIEAWNQADIDRMTSLLSTDIRITMPPDRTLVENRSAVVEFILSNAPNRRLDSMRLTPTMANRRPAFAIYRKGTSTNFERFSIVTIETRKGAINRMVAYLLPQGHFDRFRLPQEL